MNSPLPSRRTLAPIFPLLALLAAAPAVADDQAFVSVRILSAELANRIAVTAEQDCKKRGFQVSVAVTDRFGNLLAFVRDPLAGAHTIGMAQTKAHTAATFQGATLELVDRLNFLQGTPGLALVGGGVPVSVGGFIYGAVGVSGAPRENRPGDVDHACARAGIATVTDVLEFAG